MARPYSQDLRERVVLCVASGATCREAAVRFGVGVATAVRWSHRHRTTGDASPPSGHDRKRVEGWGAAPSALRIAFRPASSLRSCSRFPAKAPTPFAPRCSPHGQGFRRNLKPKLNGDKHGVHFATITETTTPRIYVTCLAAYNNGYLHGAWVDAAQDAWALYDDVKDMLAASPVAGAEEWAIHDYEGFGGVRIEEYTGFDTVAALATFITEHSALGAALLDYYSGDLAEAQEAIADRYYGPHASLAN